MTIQPDISSPLVEKDGRLNRQWVDFITRQISALPLLDESATLAEVITAYNNLITAAKSARMMK